jgi:tetratricopeptide (TPR) repeat protein
MRGFAPVVIAVLSAFGQAATADVYSTALNKYLAGDSESAVEALGTLRPPDIQKQAEALSAVTGEGSSLAAATRRQAAAMLHTEYALFADADDRSVRFHIETAHTLLSADRQRVQQAHKHTSNGESSADARDAREVLSRWSALTAGTFLLRGMDWDARAYVDETLTLVPDDPRMLFWHARISEFSAVWSPSRPLPPDAPRASAPRDTDPFAFDAGYMRSLWGPVEAEYRRTLAVAPGDLEARLHLGYVLLLLHRFPEARSELDAAARDSTDRDIRYLAHLFLARLSEALRDVAGAIREYERALEVEPGAQSAVVALSLLEDVRGNRERARDLIAAFAAIPAAQRVDDPWPNYRGSRVPVGDLEWLRGRVRR